MAQRWDSYLETEYGIQTPGNPPRNEEAQDLICSRTLIRKFLLTLNSSGLGEMPHEIEAEARASKAKVEP